MSNFNGMVIKISSEGCISVEEHSGGIVSHKDIDPDSLMGCINKSIVRGKIHSGLLPKNCLSFSKCDDGSKNSSKNICIFYPEDRADITFMKTVYRGFPLPRLVFEFMVNCEDRIYNSRLGVIDVDAIIKPSMKMFRWPLSNVSNTKICLGNNPLPICKSLHTLSSIPHLIMGMPNNLDHYSCDSNRKGLQMRELLELLKDKEQSYYYEHILVPSGTTLGDFIV